MATTEDFLTDILIEVPDCPDLLIENKIMMVVRDFCQRSWALEQKGTQIDSVVGQQDYTVDDPTGYEVIAIKEILVEPSISTTDIQKDRLTRFTYKPPTISLWDLPSSVESISYN